MKVTIQDVLKYYDIHLARITNRNALIHCPFHEDKKPSCSISFEKNQWYCFPCSEGGGIVKFIMKKEGCGRDQAYEFLRRHFNADYTVREITPEKEEDKKWNAIFALWEKVVRYQKHNGVAWWNNGVEAFGMLSYCLDNKNILRHQEKEYYFTTQQGKMEKSLTYLELEKCLPLMGLINEAIELPAKKNKILTALHKAKDIKGFYEEADEKFWKYLENKSMFEQLMEQMWFRMHLGFRVVKMVDKEAFEKLKNSWMEFYEVLDTMARAGDGWNKHLQEIDWITMYG